MKAIILVYIQGEERYVSGYYSNSINELEDKPLYLLSSKSRNKAFVFDTDKHGKLIGNIARFLEDNKTYFLTKIL